MKRRHWVWVTRQTLKHVLPELCKESTDRGRRPCPDANVIPLRMKGVLRQGASAQPPPGKRADGSS